MFQKLIIVFIMDGKYFFLGIGGGEANSSADMFVAQEHDNLQRDFEQKT